VHHKNFRAADDSVIAAEHNPATELGWAEIIWRKVRRTSSNSKESKRDSQWAPQEVFFSALPR
jgi:hypothetical protein